MSVVNVSVVNVSVVNQCMQPSVHSSASITKNDNKELQIAIRVLRSTTTIQINK